MLKLNKLAAPLLASVLVAAPAFADANSPFITVNDVSIPQYVVDAFVAEQKARGIEDGPELKNAIREEMLRRALLLGEAKKKGFEKRIEVKGQIEVASQLVLIRSYLADYVKSHPVTDAELKKGYSDLLARLGNTDYKIRHILVETENEAKDLIAKLDKGEKFANLAKFSKDSGSREVGGDLGWNTPAAYVPPFRDAVKALAKGKYTKTPVQTPYGYHVILVEDTRALTPPALEDLKPQLTQDLTQKKVEDLIKELKAKATIR
ncbi:MAG: peptidylprolyl isomerase [Zoogloeaceae bacterium]|jgi:peptidyl-prolyl cis-trans isomerase C|nr:peptidylprolyl isomerase [Zoogloeaceae bacterium]